MSYLINDVWKKLCSEVLDADREVSPRQKGTLELVGTSCKIDLEHPVMTLLSRKLSYQFMFAEAAWILSGSNRLYDLLPYAPSYGNFSDDGATLSGAYGPRWVDQVQYVIKTFLNDRDSRQAVITYWKVRPEPSKDIPCTISTQFLIRNNTLHAVHHMRSSDLWLGFPYDMFSFAMATLWIAIELNEIGFNLRLGKLHFSCGSQHLYHKDVSRMYQLLSHPEQLEWHCPMLSPNDFPTVKDLLIELIEMRDYTVRKPAVKSTFFRNIYESLTSTPTPVA